jgi:hypothetical protein
VDGCPFAVANQQWRSVFFDCPLIVKIDFQTRKKKQKTKNKKKMKKRRKQNHKPQKKKKEKLQDPLEMKIHGLHIQEHERAKKRDLKIMFRT